MTKPLENVVISKVRYPSPHSRIRMYKVTYWSEGLQVKGLLAEPSWGDSMPGLLYLRGGIKKVGYVRVARIIQMASEGFVVFAPYYRGNEGAEGNEDFCGDDRMDAINGFDVLQTHPKVNGVHIFGFSRGGVMALFTAIAHAAVTKSLVIWGGVTDMKLAYEERVDLRKMLKRVIGGSVWKFPERYEWRTPLKFIETIQCPVLIIHGAQDKNVSITHAKILREQLLNKNKQVETWFYENLNHHFPYHFKNQVTENLLNWMKQQ
jgi:dipeptidyl aminopeptidase/acylaminoacyl peptidase